MPSQTLTNRLALAREPFKHETASPSIRLTCWRMVSTQALVEDEVEIWKEAERMITLLEGVQG